ncbi:transmembrane protein, putative [Bodo saltans]|uniref:Transmembrane protein, putative n=1 Tax=Bodo saltans TaxID=75058 RepID=A0A0S4JJ95_BODSA|nr:transmembrane protein, putative [Bodo saltans]|eukprot:CUG90240.1 transmembrane protein, putative [Bodo saltans]
MNDAALSYFADACQHGLVSLCSADQFQCPAGAVQRLCHNASAIGEGSVNGWQSLALLLEETFLNSYILSDAVCNASRNRMCSITECAMYCSADSQSKNDSIALVDFMDAYSVSMNVIVIDFFPSYANCSALSESLLSPEIHGTLCNELTPQLEGISSLFVFLSSLSIAALILLALANNRYQKLEQNVDEPTPPQPTIVEDAEGEPPRSISSTSITYWGRLQGDRESVSDARVLYGTGVNRLGYPSREEPFLGLVIGSSATSRATSYGSVQRER